MIPEIMKKLLLERQIDFHDGKFVILGREGILLPTDSLILLQHTIESKFGKEKAKAILSSIGENQGSVAIQRYFDKFGFDVDKAIKLTIDLIPMLGLGNLSINSLDFIKKTAVFTLNNNPIAHKYLELYGNKKKPIDYYFLGIIEGVIKLILKDKKIIVEETKCIAKGDKYCEFTVSPGK